MNHLPALVWIALGGALGSVSRAVVGLTLATRFPWATLVVNGVGSLAIGWIMARFGAGEPAASARLVNLLAVGFCGGFTTFSTFSWQTLDQMQKGQWGAAIANVVLSVSLCLLAAWAGFNLGKA
jgi:fluoride exporter